MHSSDSPPPSLFSAVRIASLLTSLLVALGSGTNYVFSAYGPQLGARLHLSHTKTNIVGLSGNLGVYGTAPIWGRLVDSRGPRILLIIALVTLLPGYAGIHLFYEEGLPEGARDLSIWGFAVLAFCGFLTGVGGNAGLVSGMNATAKSWPDRARATTTGLVLSGFGLSAFLFSTIAHVFYPGDTSTFLLILAIGTSAPMIVGFFFVQPVPLPISRSLEQGYSHLPAGEDPAEEIHDDEYPHNQYDRPNMRSASVSSHTRLLSSDRDNIRQTLFLDNPLSDDEEASDQPSSDDESTISSLVLPRTQEIAELSSESGYVVPPNRHPASLALSPPRRSLSASTTRHRSRSSVSRRGLGEHRSQSSHHHSKHPNIWGKALARSRLFWVLFTITSLLSGTGLMYINNVGSISQALYANNNPAYDEVTSAQLQALQVSTISIMNCVGRIVIGVIADFAKNFFHLPRSFCVSLVATLFIISQLSVYSTEDVEDLWKASALLGFAYGAMFGLFPTITIEWFGLAHFSENWGFVSVSPMIGGNIFSIAFGRNLDAHARSSSAPKGIHHPSVPLNATSTSTLSSSISSIASTTLSNPLPLITTRGGIDLPSSHQCLSGRECYESSLVMTTVACFIALGLAVYTGWKDWQLHHRHRDSTHGRREVVWDNDGVEDET